MALPIWENENLVDERMYRRTWRERLFTLPWEPWLDRKTVKVPSTVIYRTDVALPFSPYKGGVPQKRPVLMCHPMMAERIRFTVKRNPRKYINILRQAKDGTIRARDQE